MPQYYDLVSRASAPVGLDLMKRFVKQTSSADDTLLQSLIDTATEYGEDYTGRSFRVQTWNLLLDEFTDRITILRHPVDTITHVKHLVSDVQVTVDSTTYYLKQLTQCAEILLTDGSEWPSDTDEREQAIEIQFVTKAYLQGQSRIFDALKRHVAHMYMNRGDCDVSDAAKKSGAIALYQQFRISRV